MAVPIALIAVVGALVDWKVGCILALAAMVAAFKGDNDE